MEDTNSVFTVIIAFGRNSWSEIGDKFCPCFCRNHDSSETGLSLNLKAETWLFFSVLRTQMAVSVCSGPHVNPVSGVFLRWWTQNGLKHWPTLILRLHSTIWYELHAREWPYKSQPAEVIIWQIGSGMKPNLAQSGMGKEILVRALLFRLICHCSWVFIFVKFSSWMIVMFKQ